MSRIGKKPIDIPEGVEVKLDNQEITIKGPKGELKNTIHPKVKVVQQDSQLRVAVAKPRDKKERSLWGLWRSLLSNMVQGVTLEFAKTLEINGVGYRAELKGDKVVFSLGYSHDIEFPVPEEIDITIDKNILTVKGIDKQLVGEVAAQIRALRKPEPYKGKGIKYKDEVIIRKAGKAAKGAGA